MRLLDRRRSRMLASLALGVLSFLSSALLAEPPKPRPANADKLEDAQSLLQTASTTKRSGRSRRPKLANGSCVECRIGLARAFQQAGRLQGSPQEHRCGVGIDRGDERPLAGLQ